MTDDCVFVPAHEPWSCSTHPGGMRTNLTHATCSKVTLRFRPSERDKVLRLLGEHEGNGCCDPKTLEHLAQSVEVVK